MKSMRRWLVVAAVAVLAGCGSGGGGDSGPGYTLTWDKSLYVASDALGTRAGVPATLTIVGTGDQSMTIGVNFKSSAIGLPAPGVWFMTLGRTVDKSNAFPTTLNTAGLAPGTYTMTATLNVNNQTWTAVANILVQ